jgi:hypothetical protein
MLVTWHRERNGREGEGERGREREGEKESGNQRKRNIKRYEKRSIDYLIVHLLVLRKKSRRWVS